MARASSGSTGNVAQQFCKWPIGVTGWFAVVVHIGVGTFWFAQHGYQLFSFIVNIAVIEDLLSVVRSAAVALYVSSLSYMRRLN